MPAPEHITPQDLAMQLARAPRLWLFLDYDGTLAGFAPTPDDILPDQELIALLASLSARESLRVAIISGRRLAHIQKLLPSSGLIRAGTYGIELEMPEKGEISLVQASTIRPLLDDLKPRWQALLAQKEGFFLEDKGWALAIHARRANPADADRVLEQAERLLSNYDLHGAFQVQGGERFLEVSPHLAEKGKAITYLLEEYPWPAATLVYAGDDDKDEPAFEVINHNGGISVLISAVPRQSHARYRLENPSQVRLWLNLLSEQFR